MVIQHLLTAAGSADVGQDLVSVTARGAEAPADWQDLRSPENYTGYERTEGFASLGGVVQGRRRLPRSRRAAAQPVGPVGGMDHERPGRHAERSRRADRLPLPRPRSQPGLGPPRQAPRCGSRSSSTGSRRAPPAGPTWTSGVTGPPPSSGCTSSSGSPPVSADRTFEIISWTPASRPSFHLRLDRGQVAASGEAEHRSPRRKGEDGSGRDQERMIPFYPDPVDPGVRDDENGAVVREVRRVL